MDVNENRIFDELVEEEEEFIWMEGKWYVKLRLWQWAVNIYEDKTNRQTNTILLLEVVKWNKLAVSNEQFFSD